MNQDMKNIFMDAAIEEAYEGIRKGHGGPFGAVVVKDGKIVGRGHNRVDISKDPTAHGEIDAIRNACENLGTEDLIGCDVYTTAEPCPMCRAAMVWANIGKTFYGGSDMDTADIGCRNAAKYDRLKADPEGRLDSEQFRREDCLQIFKEYEELQK